MEGGLLPLDREYVERKFYCELSFIPSSRTIELYGAQCAVSICTICATISGVCVQLWASSSIWQLMSLDFLSSLYSRKNPSIFRSLLWSMSHREHILTRFVIMDINFTFFYAHFLYSFYFSTLHPPTHPHSSALCASELASSGYAVRTEHSRYRFRYWIFHRRNLK